LFVLLQYWLAHAHPIHDTWTIGKRIEASLARLSMMSFNLNLKMTTQYEFFITAQSTLLGRRTSANITTSSHFSSRVHVYVVFGVASGEEATQDGIDVRHHGYELAIYSIDIQFTKLRQKDNPAEICNSCHGTSNTFVDFYQQTVVYQSICCMHHLA